MQVFVVLKIMGGGEIPRACEAEGSETTIEIKIKTLDSQTYTLRVDKQVIAFASTIFWLLPILCSSS